MTRKTNPSRNRRLSLGQGHQQDHRRRGQRGNVVVYVIVFMIGWFAFFVIKDWIKDTKESRLEKSQRKAEEGPYQEDLYSNPYQRSK